jgi:hypothetical protein
MLPDQQYDFTPRGLLIQYVYTEHKDPVGFVLDELSSVGLCCHEFASYLTHEVTIAHPANPLATTMVCR